jgi:hypothetical protein
MSRKTHQKGSNPGFYLAYIHKSASSHHPECCIPIIEQDFYAAIWQSE